MLLFINQLHRFLASHLVAFSVSLAILGGLDLALFHPEFLDWLMGIMLTIYCFYVLADFITTIIVTKPRN